MFSIRKKSFDDLLRQIYLKLLGGKGVDEVDTTKGRSLEVFAVHMELTNPRARISRSIQRARIFSAIGEFLWYMSGSGSLDQISYYVKGYSEFSDDGLTLNGAYGPRIFSNAGEASSTWHKAVSRLRGEKTRETRNAVIPIAKKEYFLSQTKDKPCTCTLQFFLRRRVLHLQVHMRSNDVYLGLPHDIFAFTMLQEITAREVGAGLGTYIHSVGSLHLYADPRLDMLDHRESAQKYLDEGLYSHQAMPPMPQGSQMGHIGVVLLAERELRQGNLEFQTPEGLPAYWQDIITLLRAYAYSKLTGTERSEGQHRCVERLHHREFALYILDRIQLDAAKGK